MGRVTHTYCIFCGSVPRHKASGKQKGCLQWDRVRRGARSAFQGPGEDPAADGLPATPSLGRASAFSPLPLSLCNFGRGSLGTDGTGPLEGRVTHRTEAVTLPTPQHKHRGDPQKLLGTWTFSYSTVRQDSHAGRTASLHGVPRMWRGPGLGLITCAPLPHPP